MGTKLLVRFGITISFTLLVLLGIFTLVHFEGSGNMSHASNNARQPKHLHATPNRILEVKTLEEIRNKDTITIAAVACSSNLNDYGIYKKTAVMFKSALISARAHRVKKLAFHLFLEHFDKTEYIISKFKEYGVPLSDIKVSLHFHSAVKVVPTNYVQQMNFHRQFRCSYVKAFFPEVLQNVNAALYLDLDTLVTGDISLLWSSLYKMDESQLVAMSRNTEPEDKVNINFEDNTFEDIPHPEPRGFNTGIMVMNLTKMRELQWHDKLLKLFDAYVPNTPRGMTAQRLINIMLFYNPALVLQLGCEYNFRHIQCEKGLTCSSLKQSTGIQVLHGTDKTFYGNTIFAHTYQVYEKFNIRKHTIQNHLYVPVRKFYEIGKNSSNPCFLAMHENLFKNM